MPRMPWITRSRSSPIWVFCCCLVSQRTEPPRAGQPAYLSSQSRALLMLAPSRVPNRIASRHGRASESVCTDVRAPAIVPSRVVPGVHFLLHNDVTAFVPARTFIECRDGNTACCRAVASIHGILQDSKWQLPFAWCAVQKREHGLASRSTGRLLNGPSSFHSSALLSRATAALEPPRPALACVLLCRFLQQVPQQPRNLNAGTSNKALRLRLGAGPLAFQLPPEQRASEKENSNVYLESAHDYRFHWQ